MRIRPALTTGLAAVSLFVLAACAAPGGGADAEGAGGTGDGGSGGSSGGSTGAGGTADCLVGAWSLDTDDLAAQLQEFFASNGSPVTSTVSEGAVTLDVDDETMTYDSAVTITATADMDGLAMVIVQEHTGVSTGRWAAEGDEVVFSDWENGITITNTITMGGEAIGDSLDLPADTGAGVPMAVSCDGDTMTSKPDESPFTSTWVRVG